MALEEEQAPALEKIRQGKFGNLFQKEVEGAYSRGNHGWDAYCRSLGILAFSAEFEESEPSLSQKVWDKLECNLLSGPELNKCLLPLCARDWLGCRSTGGGATRSARNGSHN